MAQATVDEHKENKLKLLARMVDGRIIEAREFMEDENFE